MTERIKKDREFEAGVHGINITETPKVERKANKLEVDKAINMGLELCHQK